MSFVHLFSDETVDTLYPKNICDENKNLRKHNSLKHNEDACKQELYEITRNNNVPKKLICDLEIKNEHLEKENLCLKETIKTLKDEIVNINKKQIKSADQVSDQSILLEKDKEIHKLQNEIETMNSVKITINTKLEEEMERIAVENIKLNNEIETLTESCIKKEHLAVVHEFKEIIDNLKEQISQLQNHLKCKQEEVNDAATLINFMSEALAMQSAEIEMMKNTSSKQLTKGKFLFAEVNDRCLQLKKKMRSMNHKYIDMKNKLTMEYSEMRNIQIDYQNLINKLQEQTKEIFTLTDLQEEAYQTKKKDLTESINFLKAELNNSKIEVDIKTDRISPNIDDFIYITTNVSRKEFKTFKEKIVSQLTDFFILKEFLIQAKKEVSKLTFEALSHKAIATVQQVKIKELKTKLGIPTYSSILKNSQHNSLKLLNIINEEGESDEKLKLKESKRSNCDLKECKVSNYNLKENERENVIKPKDTISKIKKVRFSEDTQERPHKTERTKFKSKRRTIKKEPLDLS